MKKRTPKFSSNIPELKPIIDRYGCGLKACPPYVIFGEFNSPSSGRFGGILAAAECQFHAYLLLREIRKSGNAKVLRTEYHPQPNFDIANYRATLKAQWEKQQAEKAAAALEVQYPRSRIVSWGNNAPAKKDS